MLEWVVSQCPGRGACQEVQLGCTGEGGGAKQSITLRFRVAKLTRFSMAQMQQLTGHAGFPFDKFTPKLEHSLASSHTHRSKRYGFNISRDILHYYI